MNKDTLKSNTWYKYTIESSEPTQEVKKDNNIELLQQATLEIFSGSGCWPSTCFHRPKELYVNYVPCHLRDNDWLIKLLNQILKHQGKSVPKNVIRAYVKSSKFFQEQRHTQEQKIVKWQIQYMKNGGEGWLLPKDADDCFMMFGTNQDLIFREGVVKTLSKIGMHIDAIEEGLECNADIWRDYYIDTAYEQEFNPQTFLLPGVMPEPDDAHKNNWVMARNYDYYQAHKDSVDKYGKKSIGMNLTQSEANLLKEKLAYQNAERRQLVEYILKDPDSRITYHMGI